MESPSLEQLKELGHPVITAFIRQDPLASEYLAKALVDAYRIGYMDASLPVWEEKPEVEIEFRNNDTQKLSSSGEANEYTCGSLPHSKLVGNENVEDSKLPEQPLLYPRNTIISRPE